MASCKSDSSMNELAVCPLSRSAGEDGRGYRETPGAYKKARFTGLLHRTTTLPKPPPVLPHGAGEGSNCQRTLRTHGKT